MYGSSKSTYCRQLKLLASHVVCVFPEVVLGQGRASAQRRMTRAARFLARFHNDLGELESIRRPDVFGPTGKFI
jgi:hypothetical protein